MSKAMEKVYLEFRRDKATFALRGEIHSLERMYHRRLYRVELVQILKIIEKVPLLSVWDAWKLSRK